MKLLSLYEEIMLLALRDDEGTFTGKFVEYAVAGAILAELLLDEHVFIADDRRKLIDHRDPPPTGDPIIDECLEKITQAKRRASIANWVPRLSRIPNLRRKVAQRLCERGIVKADEDKVLLLFPRTIYPEIDPEPEREIIQRLRRVLGQKKKAVDPKTAILISLADGTDLLRPNLGEDEVRAKKDRIDQIVAGEAIGAAARDVIRACEAATSVSALIPALLAGNGSS